MGVGDGDGDGVQVTVGTDVSVGVHVAVGGVMDGAGVRKGVPSGLSNAGTVLVDVGVGEPVP
jgi:hypothetical protein